MDPEAGEGPKLASADRVEEGVGKDGNAHGRYYRTLEVKFQAQMRILHLAKYYWPRSGGMARVVQDLAEAVGELGHHVEVVAVERFLDRHTGPRSAIRVTRAYSFGAVGAEIAPGYLRAAWRSADLIHVHHPHALADVVSLLSFGRTPVVVTQHADNPHPIQRPLARLVLRRARAIVVPSRAHIAMCCELDRSESKVSVIPFGIDTRRWEVVPAPVPGNPPRAIFIGPIVRWKGVDILLRALERTPGLHLDVVGSGPDLNRVRTLSQALAVQDRVRWFGEYPDEDLPRRMADADFLVLPSTTVDEKFGLVVLEAMAAGRPVITTAVPSGVREVNVPDQTGFEVAVRDVEGLATAMQRLAGDPSLRERLGRGGRTRVREQFSREQMARRHIALYSEVVESPKPPREE